MVKKIQKAVLFFLLLNISIFNAYGSDSIGKAQESIDNIKNEVGFTRFTEDQDVYGSGMVMAIIDTGVDVGHPDLQTTRFGSQKIIDFVDFTEEGKVVFKYKVTLGTGAVATEWGFYDFSGIKTKSRQIYIGVFDESRLDKDAPFAGDLNRDGKTGDKFLVVLTDSIEEGVYNVVYVDTNGDRSFADEKPLKLYSWNRDYEHFKTREGQKGISFVLAEINVKDKYVKLGFDGNGHGTSIAGVAAAYSMKGDGYTGVAPGAKLMIIKAIASNGVGSHESIVRAMEYAASRGAHVVNISIGARGVEQGEEDIQSNLADTLSRRYNTIFVAAAGNEGPSLGSVASPATGDAVVAVGAFVTPRMWKIDYNLDVLNPSIRYFSANGPRKDGLFKPDIVAPGSVYSIMPQWWKSPVMLNEGTSVAAPFVSGGIVLLLEAAHRVGIKPSARFVRLALQEGAEKIRGYGFTQQGFGVVNLQQSFAIVQQQRWYHPLQTAVLTPQGEMAGFFNPGQLPGRLPVVVKNPYGVAKIFTLNSTDPSVRPIERNLLVDKVSERKIFLTYRGDVPEGIHDAYISGKNRATGQRDIFIPSTVINPIDLTEKHEVDLQDSLEAGQMKRYFLNVPSGGKKVRFTLAAPPKEGDKVRGKVKMFVNGPGMEEPIETEYTGSEQKEVVYEAENPAAGIYEVMVYSAPDISQLGLVESEYLLKGWIEGEKTYQSRTYQSGKPIFAQLLPKELAMGKRDYLTLKVFDMETKAPLTAWAEINMRLYYIDRGVLIFPVKPQNETLNLNIKIDAEGYETLEQNYTFPVEEEE